MTNDEREELGDGTSRDLARLVAACVQLIEHFDSVQIVATKTEGEFTRKISAGRGNHYARIGSIQEVLNDLKYQMDAEDEEDDD